MDKKMIKKSQFELFFYLFIKKTWLFSFFFVPLHDQNYLS